MLPTVRYTPLHTVTRPAPLPCHRPIPADKSTLSLPPTPAVTPPLLSLYSSLAASTATASSNPRGSAYLTHHCHLRYSAGTTFTCHAHHLETTSPQRVLISPHVCQSLTVVEYSFIFSSLKYLLCYNWVLMPYLIIPLLCSYLASFFGSCSLLSTVKPDVMFSFP